MNDMRGAWHASLMRAFAGSAENACLFSIRTPLTLLVITRLNDVIIRVAEVNRVRREPTGAERLLQSC